MAKLFTFEVHTPYRLFFSEQVEAVVMTLLDGEIGIYAGHVPITSPVLTGVLKIKDKEGNWKEAFVAEGIVEAHDKKVILLVDSAEWPWEIDYDRALTSKKNAEDVLKTRNFKFEIVHTKARLKRAEARIKVYKRGEELGLLKKDESRL